MGRLSRGILHLLRGLRTLWLILGITLLLVAALELSLRGVKRLWRAHDRAETTSREGFQQAAWVSEWLEVQRLYNRVEWRPYVHYRGAPLSTRYINIGPDGLRRTKQADPPPSSLAEGAQKPKRTIWVFGGSVTWGWPARDEHTIPSELARELAATGHNVEVVNYGQVGYVCTQDVLTLLGELRAGRRPDAVVFLGGYNDLMSALQEGVAGLPQNEHKRREELNMRLGGALVREARDSGMMWLVRGLLRRAGLERDPRQSFGGPGQPTAEALGADVARSYTENVRLVEQVRLAHGFQALYYLQPVVFWKTKQIGYEVEAANTWPAMKELLVHVREQLAADPPVPDTARCRDLTNLFDDSPQAIFVDTCHFSEDRNAEVARIMAQDLEVLWNPADQAAAL